MKKLRLVPTLMLLLMATFGVAGAWAEDHSITVVNDSKGTVRVALVWSGGGNSQITIAAGGSNTSTISSAIDSVKVTANGKCRETTETFNPQRVNRVTLQCKGDTYTLKLEQTKPAP